MRSVGELVTLSTTFLKDKGIANARREVVDIIAWCLSFKQPLDLYMAFERPCDASEVSKIRQAIGRRAAGIPFFHITGEMRFGPCLLLVSPDALIPRPETELLYERVMKAISGEGRLLDLCCGTGCLGLALAKTFPKLEVVLSDVSPQAIRLARRNAEKNNLDVTFVEGDLLQPHAGEMYDFVVCNPPYIAESVYEALHPEVRLREPKQALVGGEDGLSFYRKLAQELPKHMNSQGKLFFEIGYDQGESVPELFKNGKKKVEEDFSGHPRFFFLEFE